jgi:hypothetical protein
MPFFFYLTDKRPTDAPLMLRHTLSLGRLTAGEESEKNIRCDNVYKV